MPALFLCWQLDGVKLVFGMYDVVSGVVLGMCELLTCYPVLVNNTDK